MLLCLLINIIFTLDQINAGLVSRRDPNQSFFSLKNIKNLTVRKHLTDSEQLKEKTSL